jgi:hypothetical protein
MYYDDHNPPHFHARYGDESVVIRIDTLSVLEGYVSARAFGLIIEWAAQHKEELIEDWNLAQKNQAPKKITPLK